MRRLGGRNRGSLLRWLPRGGVGHHAINDHGRMGTFGAWPRPNFGKIDFGKMPVGGLPKLGGSG